MAITSPFRLAVFLLLIVPFSTLANPVPLPDANAPSKLQPRSPMPSRRMGQRRAKKPEPVKKKDYSSFLCPGGSVACPVPSASSEITAESTLALKGQLNSLADWFRVGFECIELETELNSCGGCLALGAGQDCATISNAKATGCELGSCAVYSCMDGFVVSPDRSSCVKRGTTFAATPVTAVTTPTTEEPIIAPAEQMVLAVEPEVAA